MAVRPPPVHTPSARNSVDAELATYGIRRVPADYFIYGAYRYSQLADALAQAKLEQPRLEAPSPARPGIEPAGPAKLL